MPAEHPLDNVVWHALTGPQAGFALGEGRARWFKPEYAPFAAITENVPAAHADLARAVPPGTVVGLVRTAEEPTPSGWETVNRFVVVQMVADAPIPHGASSPLGDPVVLGDADDMQDLVARTKPGPFAARTPELGHYVGYRNADRLRAMGGERLRLADAVEVSAIAVDPLDRGLGLGAAIVLYLARRIQAQGKLPFLHVFPENPAMALYHRLGFRERRRLFFILRRRVSD